MARSFSPPGRSSWVGLEGIAAVASLAVALEGRAATAASGL